MEDSNLMCSKSSSCVLTFVLIVCSLIPISVHAELDERELSVKRLMFDLFEKNGYNPLIRPVRNTNETLVIEFSLALSQIINVDEVNQVMKTNVWLQIYWSDFQLGWEPTQYANVKSIRVTPDKVWVPDFVLFNNADGTYEVTFKSNCVLYNDRTVSWIPPAIYHSSCTIDVQYFPFDQQTCEMKFGSWTHTGNAIKYSFYQTMDKLDLTDYLENGSWDIIDCPGTIVNETDQVTGETKELLVFKFVLRRKTLFYTVNLIIPCVLISFVSICVFALPADAGEKITLCISILLAQVVFLLLVSKILPPSLSIPLIAKYLLFTFVINLIAILLTVIIINRNYRTPRTHQMPYWVRVVFLRELPKYLFMKRPDHDERWSGDSFTSELSFPSSPEMRRVDLNVNRTDDLLELHEVHRSQCKLPVSMSHEGRCQLPSRSQDRGDPQSVSLISQSRGGEHLQHHSNNRKHVKSEHQESEDSSQFNMTPELMKTIEAVKFIYNHLKQEEEYETILEDWKYVARVLDRLLLIIFLFVTLAGTAAILLNAPHILSFVDQNQVLDEIKAYIERKRAPYLR